MYVQIVVPTALQYVGSDEILAPIGAIVYNGVLPAGVTLTEILQGPGRWLPPEATTKRVKIPSTLFRSMESCNSSHVMGTPVLSPPT